MRYVRSVLFRRYRNSGWFGRQNLQNDLSIFQDFVWLTPKLIYSIYYIFSDIMKLLLIILTFAYGTHGWSGGDFQGADAKWVSH